MNILAAGVFMAHTSDLLSSDSLANQSIIKDIPSFLEGIYRLFSIRFLRERETTRGTNIEAR